MASIAVRINEDLYELAKTEAKRQHRSITKQIELWLAKGATAKVSEEESQKHYWQDNGFMGCCEVESDFASNYKANLLQS
jgi:hypothetical protein